MRAPTPAEEKAAAVVFKQAAADGLPVSRRQALRLAQAVIAAQHAAVCQAVTIDGATITARGVEILRLFPQGLTNEQIAKRLFLGLETVKSHIKSLYEALGAKDRATAVALGMVHGLILPSDVLPVTGERAA